MRSFSFAPLTALLELLAALLVAAALLMPAAMAQQPLALPEVAPQPSAEDLRALAATLEDEGRRKELVASIRALIAVREHQQEKTPELSLGDRLLGYAAGASREAKAALDEVGGYFRGWPVLVGWIEREMSDPTARASGRNEALSFFAIFAAGWSAGFLLWWLFRGPRRRLDRAARRNGLSRVLPIVARALVDLAPLIGLFAAAYATALAVEPAPIVRAVGLNFVHAYLTARGLIIAARLLLAPESAALRLLPVHDHVARTLLGWARRFVITAVVGYFVIAAAQLLGLPRRGGEVLLIGLGLALAGLAVAFVLSYRRRVTASLDRRAERASQRYGTAQMLEGLAAVWHVLAIAYVIGFFVIAAFDIRGGLAFMLRGTAASLLIVAGVWLVLLVVSRGLGSMTDPHRAGTAESVEFRLRLSRYLPILTSAIRLAVVAVAAFLLLEAWGVGAFNWLQHPLGKRALGATASISLVIGFAVVVWEAASAAIERYLSRQDRNGSAAQRNARMRTLLPLLRKALFVFLSLMVTLITLSELGVNIAPLLAGAGVVGLAIGFGAQKLVQDVITGIFMLVEDALAVGDVVNVAGVGGLVEDLSIRSIRLRDLAGTVHTVPFSAVTTVSNMTKGFSYYVFNIGVDYREDTDRVSEVCKEIVDEMRADTKFGPDILEPLEVFGIDKFDESAVIIQARVKTKPIKQWTVAREFNRRMKKRFAELGIEIPYPHRSVYVGFEGSDDRPFRVRIEGLAGAAGIPADGGSDARDLAPHAIRAEAAAPRPAEHPGGPPMRTPDVRTGSEVRSGQEAMPAAGARQSQSESQSEARDATSPSLRPPIDPT